MIWNGLINPKLKTQLQAAQNKCIHYLMPYAELGDKNLTHLNLTAVFHMETSHLICFTNQVTGFYVKYNTGL